MRNLLLVLAFSTALHSQAPNQGVPTPQPAPENRATNAPVAPNNPIKFGLSKDEEYQRQILVLKRDLMQAKVEQLQKEFAGELQGFITDVMRVHQDIPGLTFDLRNFTFLVMQPAVDPVKPDNEKK